MVSCLTLHLFQVTQNKGWGEIAKALGYSTAQTPHVKSAYLKIVQPFDDFYTYVKTSPLTQLQQSLNNPASPLTPLPGETQPPPSTSNRSQVENPDISATPSRIVGNSERLGSPVRATQAESKRRTRRTSDSAEPSRLRLATRRGKTSITPEEDLANAKDLEAVENAIKETLGEPNTTSDEAQESVQKRKRKLDALCKHVPVYARLRGLHLDLTIQLLLLHRHRNEQTLGKAAWDLSAGEEQGPMKYS